MLWTGCAVLSTVEEHLVENASALNVFVSTVSYHFPTLVYCCNLSSIWHLSSCVWTAWWWRSWWSFHKNSGSLRVWMYSWLGENLDLATLTLEGKRCQYLDVSLCGREFPLCLMCEIGVVAYLIDAVMTTKWCSQHATSHHAWVCYVLDSEWEMLTEHCSLAAIVPFIDSMCISPFLYQNKDMKQGNRGAGVLRI